MYIYLTTCGVHCIGSYSYENMKTWKIAISLKQTEIGIQNYPKTGLDWSERSPSESRNSQFFPLRSLVSE